LRNRLRLVGVAGANRVMAGELSRLARRAFDDVRVDAPDKEGPGALGYPFDARLGWLAANYHRTSARVLWELCRTRAPRLEALYAELVGAFSQDPRGWYWDGAKISVQAFSVGDFPAGERQVVGTVKNALLEVARLRGFTLHVSPEAADLTIDVRGVDDGLSIALDLAGRPVHQRGYRQVSGPAPLREDLAALLVMLSRHDSRSEILLDPMGGSGTIAIEAMGLAKALPLWCQGRAPACNAWAAFSECVRNAEPLFADTEPRVLLNEADAQTLQFARENARRAGVLPRLGLHSGTFSDLTLTEVVRITGGDATAGVIVCNPPYGERLQDRDSVRETYRALGQWCRQFRGWRAGFLVANPEFEAQFGARARIKKPLKNGPLNAMFYLFDL
jgi:23S rRNA G2445 N2-methylase RlmL